MPRAESFNDDVRPIVNDSDKACVVINGLKWFKAASRLRTLCAHFTQLETWARKTEIKRELDLIPSIRI